MKIFVKSRQMMNKVLLEDPDIFDHAYIIGINDLCGHQDGDHGRSPYEEYGMSQNCFPVTKEHPQFLNLMFSDVTYKINWTTIPMTLEQAEKIVEFLDGMDTRKDLYVHCAAGISRSSAVGLFAADYLKVDILEEPYFSPNVLVTSLLKRVAGYYKDYDDEAIINSDEEETKEDML